MKKAVCTALLILSLGIALPSANAKTIVPKEKTALTASQQAELLRIEARVQEIKDMDKSNLSSAQKKELKQELKDMRVEARSMHGGIYLSVGAIIIIILLLILIL